MAKVDDISSGGIKKLGLSPAVQAALTDIQAELAAAYRESFIEMVQAMNRQASALDRIQATLHILVKEIAPHLAGQTPEAFRVAADGERPDLASALIVADPIGTGYSLSQSNIATALNLTQTDVSILCKIFKLSEDGTCAVVVRQGRGSRQKIVNYHPRAIERLRELVGDPPPDLDAPARATLARVRRKLKRAPND